MVLYCVAVASLLCTAVLI